MNKKNQILIIVILACVSKLNFAQVTVGNNVRPATPAFNGWDGTGINVGSLDIKNEFTQPINFFTSTFPHARIDASGNFTIGITNQNNYFAIGLSGPTPIPILWQLHLTTEPPISCRCYSQWLFP